MATFITAGLETNPHNDAGCCLALYFDGVPALEEVNDAAQSQRGKHILGVYEDVTNYEIVPTILSERTKLTRVLVYDVG